MTGELIDGGSVVTRSFTREQIPYYYREGAIIPLYPRMMHLKKRPETLTLQFTPGARGEFNYYEDAGNNADYQTAYAKYRGRKNLLYYLSSYRIIRRYAGRTGLSS